MSKNTLEEFTNSKTPKGEQLAEILKNHDKEKEVSGFLMTWLNVLMDLKDIMPPKEYYTCLYLGANDIHYAFKENHESYQKEWNRIQELVKLMWCVSDGIANEFGDIEALTPHQPQEKQQEILVQLDKARNIFKNKIEDSWKTMTHIIDRNIIIHWSRMHYYHVHCFQAPNRLDPLQASRDAMGLSDHFQEMIDEIIKNTPEGIQGA